MPRRVQFALHEPCLAARKFVMTSSVFVWIARLVIEYSVEHSLNLVPHRAPFVSQSAVPERIVQAQPDQEEVGALQRRVHELVCRPASRATSLPFLCDT